VADELFRFLVSGGARGRCPLMYTVIRTARYLGCRPWDLLPAWPVLRDPGLWLRWGVLVEATEAEAQVEIWKRNRG